MPVYFRCFLYEIEPIYYCHRHPSLNSAVQNMIQPARGVQNMQKANEFHTSK